MARKQKKYHFIYKTTNLLNGKYYIGMHSTNNLEDGYLGSGRRLRYSINKHGEQNHSREILEHLDSREALKKREEEIVNLNEIAKEQCMNMKVGGIGGFTNEAHRRKFLAAGGRKVRQNFSKLHAKKLKNAAYKEAWQESIKSGLIAAGYENGTFGGKTHSIETKLKMSKSSKGKGVGKNNSQYGSFWITNGTENKKLKKNSIIPDGWYKGRKING